MGKFQIDKLTKPSRNMPVGKLLKLLSFFALLSFLASCKTCPPGDVDCIVKNVFGTNDNDNTSDDDITNTQNTGGADGGASGDTSGGTSGSVTGSTSGNTGGTSGSVSGSTTGNTGGTSGSVSGSTTGNTGGTTGSVSGSTSGNTGGTTGSTSGETGGTTGSVSGNTSGNTGGTTGSTSGETGGTSGSVTGSTSGNTGGSTGSTSGETGGTTGSASGNTSGGTDRTTGSADCDGRVPPVTVSSINSDVALITLAAASLGTASAKEISDFLVTFGSPLSGAYANPLLISQIATYDWDNNGKSSVDGDLADSEYTLLVALLPNAAKTPELIKESVKNFNNLPLALGGGQIGQNECLFCKLNCGEDGCVTVCDGNPDGGSGGTTGSTSGETGGTTGSTSGETGGTSGTTSGETGGTTGSTSGNTGGTTGSTSGETGGTTGSTSGETGGTSGTTSGETGGTTGSTSGNTGGTTGSTSGNTGGTTGSTSGNTGGTTGSTSGNTGGTSGISPTPTTPSCSPPPVPLNEIDEAEAILGMIAPLYTDFSQVELFAKIKDEYGIILDPAFFTPEKVTAIKDYDWDGDGRGAGVNDQALLAAVSLANRRGGNASKQSVENYVNNILEFNPPLVAANECVFSPNPNTSPSPSSCPPLPVCEPPVCGANQSLLCSEEFPLPGSCPTIGSGCQCICEEIRNPNDPTPLPSPSCPPIDLGDSKATAAASLIMGLSQEMFGDEFSSKQSMIDNEVKNLQAFTDKNSESYKLSVERIATLESYSQADIDKIRAFDWSPNAFGIPTESVGLIHRTYLLAFVASELSYQSNYNDLIQPGNTLELENEIKRNTGYRAGDGNESINNAVISKLAQTLVTCSGTNLPSCDCPIDTGCPPGSGISTETFEVECAAGGASGGGEDVLSGGSDSITLPRRLTCIRSVCGGPSPIPTSVGPSPTILPSIGACNNPPPVAYNDIVRDGVWSILGCASGGDLTKDRILECARNDGRFSGDIAKIEAKSQAEIDQIINFDWAADGQGGNDLAIVATLREMKQSGQEINPTTLTAPAPSDPSSVNYPDWIKRFAPNSFDQIVACSGSAPSISPTPSIVSATVCPQALCSEYFCAGGTKLVEIRPKAPLPSIQPDGCPSIDCGEFECQFDCTLVPKPLSEVTIQDAFLADAYSQLKSLLNQSDEIGAPFSPITIEAVVARANENIATGVLSLSQIQASDYKLEDIQKLAEYDYVGNGPWSQVEDTAVLFVAGINNSAGLGYSQEESQAFISEILGAQDFAITNTCITPVTPSISPSCPPLPACAAPLCASGEKLICTGGEKILGDACPTLGSGCGCECSPIDPPIEACNIPPPINYNDIVKEGVWSILGCASGGSVTKAAILECARGDARFTADVDKIQAKSQEQIDQIIGFDWAADGSGDGDFSVVVVLRQMILSGQEINPTTLNAPAPSDPSLVNYPDWIKRFVPNSFSQIVACSGSSVSPSPSCAPLDLGNCPQTGLFCPNGEVSIPNSDANGCPACPGRKCLPASPSFAPSPSCGPTAICGAPVCSSGEVLVPIPDTFDSNGCLKTTGCAKCENPNDPCASLPISFRKSDNVFEQAKLAQQTFFALAYYLNPNGTRETLAAEASALGSQTYFNLGEINAESFDREEIKKVIGFDWDGDGVNGTTTDIAYLVAGAGLSQVEIFSGSGQTSLTELPDQVRDLVRDLTGLSSFSPAANSCGLLAFPNFDGRCRGDGDCPSGEACQDVDDQQTLLGACVRNPQVADGGVIRPAPEVNALPVVGCGQLCKGSSGAAISSCSNGLSCSGPLSIDLSVYRKIAAGNIGGKSTYIFQSYSPPLGVPATLQIPASFLTRGGGGFLSPEAQRSFEQSLLGSSSICVNTNCPSEASCTCPITR